MKRGVEMDNQVEDKHVWLKEPQTKIESSQNHYSDEKFWNKILKYSKKAGKTTVYSSLLLYFTAKNPAVPKSAKLTIIGALGYLIFPADALPDFIPVIGLVDDASIIAFALYQVISHIDQATKQRAHDQMVAWFGQPEKDIDMDDHYLPEK